MPLKFATNDLTSSTFKNCKGRWKESEQSVSEEQDRKPWREHEGKERDQSDRVRLKTGFCLGRPDCY